MTSTEYNRESATAVIAWLHERGRFYFYAERRDFACVMYFDTKRKLLLPVQGDAFLAWLADCIAMNRSERSFAFVQSACETEGLSERATGIEPAAFWAATATAIYLSAGPGSMVRVTAAGVELVDNGTDGILFPYGATLAPWRLTEPIDPFSTCALFRNVSTFAPHALDLLKLWICSLPSNQRTKPPLVLSGTIGSGKTRLALGIFELFGLSPRISTVLKNGEGDFWAAMDVGGLLCMDNADTKNDWLADALAAASTAGSSERRRLYTDADRVSLKARSWLAVTSASPTFAADAGLADRLLVVRLNRRTNDTAETALSDEILAHRDAGLTWIAQTLSRALADREAVPVGLNARHPDFAKLAVRIGRAMGRGPQAEAALRAAEDDKGLFNLENDPIGSALLELLRAGPFAGTAADLVEALIKIDRSFEDKLSAQRLSKRLAKLWPHLETVLKAKSEKGHAGYMRFSFQRPEGGFGDFERAFSAKSSQETNNETLSENPLESHQTHPNAPDLSRQGLGTGSDLVPSDTTAALPAVTEPEQAVPSVQAANVAEPGSTQPPPSPNSQPPSAKPPMSITLGEQGHLSESSGHWLNQLGPAVWTRFSQKTMGHRLKMTEEDDARLQDFIREKENRPSVKVSFVRVEEGGTIYRGLYSRVYHGPPWALIPQKQARSSNVPRTILIDKDRTEVERPFCDDSTVAGDVEAVGRKE